MSVEYTCDKQSCSTTMDETQVNTVRFEGRKSDGTEVTLTKQLCDTHWAGLRTEILNYLNS